MVFEVVFDVEGPLAHLTVERVSVTSTAMVQETLLRGEWRVLAQGTGGMGLTGRAEVTLEGSIGVEWAVADLAVGHCFALCQGLFRSGFCGLFEGSKVLWI